MNEIEKEIQTEVISNLVNTAIFLGVLEKTGDITYYCKQYKEFVTWDKENYYKCAMDIHESGQYPVIKDAVNEKFEEIKYKQNEGLKLLNSKNMFDCIENDEENHNLEIKNIFEKVTSLENYNCVLIISDLDPTHKEKRIAVSDVYLHELETIYDRIGNFKNGSDLYIDKDGFLEIHMYGQYNSPNGLLDTTAIKVMPYTFPSFEFINLSDFILKNEMNLSINEHIYLRKELENEIKEVVFKDNLLSSLAEHGKLENAYEDLCFEELEKVHQELVEEPNLSEDYEME